MYRTGKRFGTVGRQQPYAKCKGGAESHSLFQINRAHNFVAQLDQYLVDKNLAFDDIHRTPSLS
jgi:hypothetical protein